MVLGAVTGGSRREGEWVTRDMGRVFLREWRQLIELVPEAERGGDVAAAYARLLAEPDPRVPEAAARAWCAWEGTHVSLAPDWAPDPRYADPDFGWSSRGWSRTTGATAASSPISRFCQDATAGLDPRGLDPRSTRLVRPARHRVVVAHCLAWKPGRHPRGGGPRRRRLPWPTHRRPRHLPRTAPQTVAVAPPFVRFGGSALRSAVIERRCTSLSISVTARIPVWCKGRVTSRAAGWFGLGRGLAKVPLPHLNDDDAGAKCTCRSASVSLAAQSRRQLPPGQGGAGQVWRAMAAEGFDRITRTGGLTKLHVPWSAQHHRREDERVPTFPPA